MQSSLAAQPESAATIEVHWRASALVSCLHAAEALARDPHRCDPGLAGVLADSVARLQATVDELAVPGWKFWEYVVPLSANLTSMRQLAEVTLRKVVSGDIDSRISPLANALTEVDATFRRAGLDQMEAIAARFDLLQGRWANEGQALLRSIGQLTDPELIPQRAEVLMVIPVQPPGAQIGGGAAHLSYNTVRLESIEPQHDSGLPEPVRLAWLIAQLNQDIPRYGETVPRQRLACVASAAMLPAALEAAFQMNLLPAPAESLPLALAQWLPALVGPAEAGENLQRWWDGVRQKQPPWSVALAALERLLP